MPGPSSLARTLRTSSPPLLSGSLLHCPSWRVVFLLGTTPRPWAPRRRTSLSKKFPSRRTCSPLPLVILYPPRLAREAWLLQDPTSWMSAGGSWSGTWTSLWRLLKGSSFLTSGESTMFLFCLPAFPTEVSLASPSHTLGSGIAVADKTARHGEPHLHVCYPYHHQW